MDVLIRKKKKKKCSTVYYILRSRIFITTWARLLQNVALLHNELKMYCVIT